MQLAVSHHIYFSLQTLFLFRARNAADTLFLLWALILGEAGKKRAEREGDKIYRLICTRFQSLFEFPAGFLAVIRGCPAICSSIN